MPQEIDHVHAQLIDVDASYPYSVSIDFVYVDQFIHAIDSTVFFFFNNTPPTDIYTLSLHDALPISRASVSSRGRRAASPPASTRRCAARSVRSEEHTSELQSLRHLVCRLLLEK